MRLRDQILNLRLLVLGLVQLRVTSPAHLHETRSARNRNPRPRFLMLRSFLAPTGAMVNSQRLPAPWTTFALRTQRQEAPGCFPVPLWGRERTRATSKPTLRVGVVVGTSAGSGPSAAGRRNARSRGGRQWWVSIAGANSARDPSTTLAVPERTRCVHNRSPSGAAPFITPQNERRGRRGRCNFASP